MADLLALAGAIRLHLSAGGESRKQIGAASSSRRPSPHLNPFQLQSRNLRPLLPLHAVAVRKRMAGDSDTDNNEDKDVLSLLSALFALLEELKNEREMRRLYQNLATDRLLEVIRLKANNAKNKE